VPRVSCGRAWAAEACHTNPVSRQGTPQRCRGSRDQHATLQGNCCKARCHGCMIRGYGDTSPSSTSVSASLRSMGIKGLCLTLAIALVASSSLHAVLGEVTGSHRNAFQACIALHYVPSCFDIVKDSRTPPACRSWRSVDIHTSMQSSSVLNSNVCGLFSGGGFHRPGNSVGSWWSRTCAAVQGSCAAQEGFQGVCVLHMHAPAAAVTGACICSTLGFAQASSVSTSNWPYAFLM